MFNDDVPLLERVFVGTRRNFLVLSRRDVRTVSPNVPYVVISVTDPESDEAEIATSTFQRHILRLQFHDVPEVDIPGLEGLLLSPDNIMSDADAEAILDFVSNHPDAELIVCHCEAGVSRSAGIAAALSRIVQGEDAYFFEHYWPNKHVYQTLLAAQTRTERL